MRITINKIKFKRMKKMFFLLVFATLGAAALTAQDHDRDRIHDADQDRLMTVDGEVLLIRDHEPILLQGRLTLCDGTIVNTDGTYLTKDLKRLRLHDGECLDNDGIKYRNEYQYRFKVKQENQGLSQAKIQERDQNRFQLMLIDGEMFQIMNQFQKRLQKKMNLGNGTVIRPNGNYQTIDHKLILLLDGECLNMAGEMFHNTCVHQQMLVQ